LKSVDQNNDTGEYVEESAEGKDSIKRVSSESKMKQLEAALEQHKILLRLSRSHSEVKELAPLLRLIAAQTSSALNADRATVFLLDKKNDELYSVVAEGEPREIRFPAHMGIAGSVAKTGKIINIPDAYKDKRFNPEIDRKTGYRTHSMLTVPMKNKDGEIIGVFQILNKAKGEFSPYDEELLLAIASQASISVENALLIEAKRRMFESLLNVLADTIDMRDPTTAGHSMKVMEYSVAIAQQMGLPERQVLVIRYAAYLHDYGKIGVRDAVLHKPDKLDKEEMAEARRHVEITRRILERIDFEEDISDIPRIASLHHERLDGSGYPRGLTSDEIPLGACIIAVADAFDALTSHRHYRRPKTIDKALAIIESDSGTKFDPQVVSALRSLVKEKALRR